VEKIGDALRARLRERQLTHDARVKIAIAGLSSDEAKLLKDKFAPGTVFGRKDTGSVDFFAFGSFPRLLGAATCLDCGASRIKANSLLARARQ